MNITNEIRLGARQYQLPTDILTIFSILICVIVVIIAIALLPLEILGISEWQGEVKTVDGNRYRWMLAQYICPQIREKGLDGCWFQQDGAPCHTAIQTMQFLQRKFPTRVMSKNVINIIFITFL